MEPTNGRYTMTHTLTWIVRPMVCMVLNILTQYPLQRFSHRSCTETYFSAKSSTVFQNQISNFSANKHQRHKTRESRSRGNSPVPSVSFAFSASSASVSLIVTSATCLNPSRRHVDAGAAAAAWVPLALVGRFCARSGAKEAVTLYRTWSPLPWGCHRRAPLVADPGMITVTLFLPFNRDAAVVPVAAARPVKHRRT